MDVEISEISRPLVSKDALDHWYKAMDGDPSNFLLALGSTPIVTAIGTLAAVKQHDTFLDVAWVENNELRTASLMLKRSDANLILDNLRLR